MPTSKLTHRCKAEGCEYPNECRRYMTGDAAKHSAVPYAAFDVRDTPEGQCDGFLPRIMAPIRVESEGGEQ